MSDTDLSRLLVFLDGAGWPYESLEMAHETVDLETGEPNDGIAWHTRVSTGIVTWEFFADGQLVFEARNDALIG